MLIYGKQPVYYTVERHPQKIRTLYLAKEVHKKEYSRLMRLGCEVKRIPANAAQSMSKNGNHQGFLAEVDDIAPVSLKEVCGKDFVVVLSGITDVGNIGAIVRSAFALGVDAVIVCGLKNLALEPIM
ncbi:MAG: RNA methyltransferase substrate-binding domain-containing protein [Sulfurimonadaceae bacterium]|nr:RNA methyltransferase substrate-binding domain-containing protein [Sulfurimonadaceae bacterium]